MLDENLLLLPCRFVCDMTYAFDLHLQLQLQQYSCEHMCNTLLRLSFSRTLIFFFFFVRSLFLFSS